MIDEGGLYYEGWEAFGAGEGDIHVRKLERGVNWPQPEIHRGIFLIEVRVHGDSDVPFIHVLGISEERVRKCYRHVSETADMKAWFLP
jgi:hypothetical protein